MFIAGVGIGGLDEWDGKMHPYRWYVDSDIGGEEICTLGTVILLYFGANVLAVFDRDVED